VSGEFFHAIAEDPAALKKIQRAFVRAIEKSFADDKSRVTMSETRRRFGILEREFRELRSGAKWSLERVLDTLPIVLRARLDGLVWTHENQRSIWAPPDVSPRGDSGPG